MLAADLINYQLPTLRPTDTVGRAVDLLHDNRVEQLVVADEGKYLGLVQEVDLLSEPTKKTLANLLLPYGQVVVRAYQHLYEILGILISHPLQVIAVLDENDKLVGSLLTADVYNQFGKALGIYEPGAIIEISLKNRDYSLAEISRLIEAEQTKITGSFISGSTTDYDNPLTLTLKVNRQNIGSVIATLERFGYTVSATYAHLPVQSNDQDRYDLLMKYLSI